MMSQSTVFQYLCLRPRLIGSVLECHSCRALATHDYLQNRRTTRNEQKQVCEMAVVFDLSQNVCLCVRFGNLAIPPPRFEHGCAAYYWAALWYEGVLLTSVMFCAAMARLPDAFAPN